MSFGIMRVNLRTLGCRLNEAESEIWAEQFIELGYRVVGELEPSEIVVLNSCAVTQDAVKKSKYLIRKIRRENPATKIVVSGCFASVEKEIAQNMLEVDLVVDNREKSNLVELTSTMMNEVAKYDSEKEEQNPLFGRGKQRAFIKVQDGCRYKCAFCIVTIARGEERSIGIREIVDRINAQYEHGVKEIVLTGVHLGGWGSDLGLKFTDLLQGIFSETEIPRIRLGSLEPWELSEKFLKQVTEGRLLPHLHLPLQSGCDEILRKMSRRCRVRDFSELVTELRSANAEMNITTDIIVGFPGESEGMWMESYEFIKEMEFGNIHVFPFSPRQGTRAYEMDGQIPESIRKMRAKQLRELAGEAERVFKEKQIGLRSEVLWEEGMLKNGLWVNQGYTKNYVKVVSYSIPDKNLSNQVSEVNICKMEENGELVAEVI